MSTTEVICASGNAEQDSGSLKVSIIKGGIFGVLGAIAGCLAGFCMIGTYIEPAGYIYITLVSSLLGLGIGLGASISRIKLEKKDHNIFLKVICFTFLTALMTWPSYILIGIPAVILFVFVLGMIFGFALSLIEVIENRIAYVITASVIATILIYVLNFRSAETNNLIIKKRRTENE